MLTILANPASILYDNLLNIAGAVGHSQSDTIDLEMDPEFRRGYWGTPITPIPDSPTARIWRYMDFGKLVSMLANGALYFPVVASLGDELEAARPRLPIGSTAKDQRIAWRSWAQWRCICFVNCWHRSPVESAAMWKIYSARNQSIAIKSTFQSLAN